MEFDWDDLKSNACLKERGFDFTHAARCFMDQHRMVSPNSRFNYGEDRFQVLGQIDERVFFAIYTLRAGVIRIISERKANHREVTRYENQTRPS